MGKKTEHVAKKISKYFKADFLQKANLLIFGACLSPALYLQSTIYLIMSRYPFYYTKWINAEERRLSVEEEVEEEKEEEENGNEEGEGDKRDKTGKFLPFSVSIYIL